jgi:hypothetical protein
VYFIVENYMVGFSVSIVKSRGKIRRGVWETKKNDLTPIFLYYACISEYVFDLFS